MSPTVSESDILRFICDDDMPEIPDSSTISDEIRDDGISTDDDNSPTVSVSDMLRFTCGEIPESLTTTEEIPDDTISPDVDTLLGRVFKAKPQQDTDGVQWMTELGNAVLYVGRKGNDWSTGFDFNVEIRF